MSHVTPTLALLGPGEIFVIAVGVLLVVGSAIANKVKQSQQSQSGSTPSPGSGGRQARLQELAARRQQQLQELARRQRAPGAGPSNITSMDQQAQRTQARTDYDRRAEALRRQRAAQQSPTQPQRPVGQQTPAPQPARRETLVQASPEQRGQLPSESRSSTAQRPRQQAPQRTQR